MKTLYTQARVFALALLVVLAGARLTRAQAQFSYTDFTSTAGLHLNGSAAAVNNGSANVLRLTPASFLQDGSAYYATPLSLSSAFTTQFTFQFTQVSPNGVGSADGISFIIQGSPATDTALGFLGGGIGYGGDDLNLFPSKGISNSLAIEIDTYRNPWDPATPHMAAMSCLTGYNSSHHGGKCANGTKAGSDPTIAINSALPSNVLDGKQHTVIVKYQLPCPGCQNLTVQLDGQQVLAVSFDLATLGLDANDDAYIGFTAATGGGFEDHDILSWTFYPDTIIAPVSAAAPTTFPFANTLTHTVDFSVAASNSNLFCPTDPTGPSCPSATLQIQSTNTIIDSVTWQQYVTGGPLATSTLFPLDNDNPGGVGPNGSLFNDLCFDPTLAPPFSVPSDTNCPYASTSLGPLLGIQIAANVSSKPQVNTGGNTGLTTALAHYEPPAPGTATWAPSTINGTPNPACSNTTGTTDSNAPQACYVLDIQQSIYGDPTSSGKTKSKGAFAMIYNVPMPLSSVSVNGTAVNAPPGNNNGFSSSLWFNNPLSLNFIANPASIPNPPANCPASTPAACNNYFTPAPIAGETYQVTDLLGNVVYPAPSNLEPAQAIPESDFNTVIVRPITFPGSSNQIYPPLPDGQYFLQWSAVDNVGISEQNVQLITSGTCPNPTGGTPFPEPCYQTTFFQAQLNVDSTPPTISGFTISPPPVYNQPSTATFTCTDPSGLNNAPASGINPTNGCVGGPNSQASGVSGNVDTSSAGPHTFTVTATDLAGNVGTSPQPYTVSQATATITLSNMTQTYTGSPLSPTVATVPSGLAYTLTGAPDTNAGSYTVTATITDPNYTGSATGMFVISRAPATVTFSNLTQTYTGSPLSPTVATVPSGLANSLTGAPDTNAGSYAVTATVTNPNYTGSAIGTFVISRAPATLTLSNLTQTYTGSPLSPTVATVPTGLAYTLTGAPDTNAGSYAVIATVTNPNYTGSANGTFVITRPAATVSPSSINFGTIRSGTSFSQNVTLTNTGNAPMKISSVVISNSGSTHDFSAVNHCSSTLGAGLSCTITVTYHADRDDANGTSATLFITDNAPGSPQSVPLSGKSK
jgi:Legume lectin domain/MBG domain/Abnormal spindle-like microcephaly-assoc'd, ASPM-SPD-2-Hydin